MLTTYGQCNRCSLIFEETGLKREFDRRQLDEYPQDLREESEKLSVWIRELKQLYKHRLVIRLIDAQSLAGVYKALRHRVREYPTFVVDGKETLSGWDKGRLEELIDRHIKALVLARRGGLPSSAS
jgi:tRNA/tmRNA/rRNA uracil-C5-methylase (TrmA/RlmC/RlmD family)